MNTSEKVFQSLGGIDYPKETEERVNRFYEELTTKRNYEKFTTFPTDLDEMVVINGLKVFSFCEHHLLPFFGYCSIGYIPDKKILGLSKFQRLVDKKSSQPSLQETITSTIARDIESILTPRGIGIAMTCVHTCMFGRGINTSTCTVNTQVLTKSIKDKSEARQEFLDRIKIENILW